MVRAHNRMLLSHKKEGSPDTRYIMDLENHAEWKSPTAKGQSVSLLHEMSRTGECRDKRLMVAGGWVGGMGSDRSWGRGDENTLERTVVTVAQLYEYTEDRLIALWWGDCSVCELHLNKDVIKKKSRCHLSQYKGTRAEEPLPCMPRHRSPSDSLRKRLGLRRGLWSSKTPARPGREQWGQNWGIMGQLLPAQS